MEKKRYKVLCIGVNNVPGLKPLYYTEKDACEVALRFSALKDMADITLLTGPRTTKQNILQWVNDCRKIKEEINIVIFFAGHGSAEPITSSQDLERCLWIDTSPSIPQDLHRLRISEILDAVDNPQHRLIFIIDACYRLDKKYETSIQDFFERFKETERMTRIREYVIISACAVNTVAFEDHRLKNGLMTYYFLDTIKGNDVPFLRSTISLFHFLSLLNKKVRNHYFVSDYGRKHPLSTLRKKGISVHHSGNNISLPILEPLPPKAQAGKPTSQKKISRFLYACSCTRLRRKFIRSTCILSLILLFFFLVHSSIIHLHWDPRLGTTFRDFLWATGKIRLDGINSLRLELEFEQTIDIYLFKANWVKALSKKLDDNGKIILLGKFLGHPCTPILGKQKLLRFALDSTNKDSLLYLSPQDVKDFLPILKENFNQLEFNNKKNALELLAQFGEYGRDIAIKTFDFKNEKVIELRRLFLKHFYFPTFWEQHVSDFTAQDYSYLLIMREKIPAPKNKKSKRELKDFIHKLELNLRSLSPGNGFLVAEKVAEIYGKLQLLANWSCPYFRQVAPAFVKKYFKPGEVLRLFLFSREWQDISAIVHPFIQGIQGIEQADVYWSEFLLQVIPKLDIKMKSQLLKKMIDTYYQVIPVNYRDAVTRYLREFEPSIIGLSDWERWLTNRRVPALTVLLAIAQVKQPQVFPFIEKHYQDFKDHFSADVFDELGKTGNGNHLSLAKKIFLGKLTTPKDKLCCATYLYNYRFKEYAAYIVRFLREARNNKEKQNILKELYYPVSKAFIRIVKRRGIPLGREQITSYLDDFRYLLTDIDLFYHFIEVNLHLWPQDVIKILSDTQVPYSFKQGIPFLRACEELPHRDREKILLKICYSDIDQTFRLNAESSLARHYPQTYINFVLHDRYREGVYREKHLIEVYQLFSLVALKSELTACFQTCDYGKIGYIIRALEEKQARGEINLSDIQDILQAFDSPIERILLRDLRYFANKCFFKVKNEF